MIILISIHAPTRGATILRFPCRDRGYNFNPRSYKRSDDYLRDMQMDITISIHAPTRGATTLKNMRDLMMIFQSTLLQEERQRTTRAKKESDSFQSTLLQEERQMTMKKAVTLIVFQSTLLQEERRRNMVNVANELKFQSTLLQEERRQKCTIILILICNNYCIVSIKSHQHYNNYFM